MSQPWSFPDRKDIQSALRHVVIPVIAGGVVAATEIAQAGALDPKVLWHTFLTAVCAGGIRLINRWASDIS